MIPTFLQALQLVGQAQDLFEASPAALGPWNLEWAGGGQLTLAGGIYIAALPVGWSVDYDLADSVTDSWQENTNTGGFSDPSSSVTNLGQGLYRLTVGATFTPSAGMPRQFNFQMS